MLPAREEQQGLAGPEVALGDRSAPQPQGDRGLGIRLSTSPSLCHVIHSKDVPKCASPKPQEAFMSSHGACSVHGLGGCLRFTCITVLIFVATLAGRSTRSLFLQNRKQTQMTSKVGLGLQSR